MIGEEDPVPVNPCGDEVTVYEVIGSLPSKLGAVKDTETAPSLYVRPDPASVAVPIVGGNGADLLDDSTIPGFFGLISVIISYIYWPILVKTLILPNRNIHRFYYH